MLHENKYRRFRCVSFTLYKYSVVGKGDACVSRRTMNIKRESKEKGAVWWQLSGHSWPPTYQPPYLQAKFCLIGEQKEYKGKESSFCLLFLCSCLFSGQLVRLDGKKASGLGSWTVETAGRGGSFLQAPICTISSNPSFLAHSAHAWCSDAMDFVDQCMADWDWSD